MCESDSSDAHWSQNVQRTPVIFPFSLKTSFPLPLFLLSNSLRKTYFSAKLKHVQLAQMPQFILSRASVCVTDCIKYGCSFFFPSEKWSLHSSWRPAGCQNDVWLCASLWENNPTSHLIYFFNNQFHNEFTSSITSFQSSSLQHDIWFLNHGSIWSKIEIKQCML